MRLALVHHANQYLITDGYPNREGISQLLDRIAALLLLHERLRIPLNLHVSGTFLEAIAWHRPRALDQLRRLRERGLLALVGGPYGQNVMPVFSQEHNRRQMETFLRLAVRHLGCDPRDIAVCWVPERVWDTRALAPVLTDPSLPNGGYQAVLLDDRLAYPVGRRYEGSARAQFDARGPGDILPWTNDQRDLASGSWWDLTSTMAWQIAGGRGLVFLPIHAPLRYAVPPSRPGHWAYLRALARIAPRVATDETILIYADDVEKAVGVGSWDPRGLERYAAFLRWLRQQPALSPCLLDDWLAATRPKLHTRRVEPGTFYELARLWGAGEDYQGWWRRPAWRHYRAMFAEAERALRRAERAGADRRLIDLAWKQVLACAYESGWHDVSQPQPRPTPWAKALASHVRTARLIAEAARWAAAPPAQCEAITDDADGDGEPEVVLRNDRLMAVVTPKRGGRLVYLFARLDDGGRLVVGNPADDWNWQEELVRYMDEPPNHPGALADVGHEHDRYRVRDAGASADEAWVELRDVQPGSAMRGAVKRLVLRAHEPYLTVCYRLPPGQRGIETELCLSPDYLRLLEEGRTRVRPLRGSHRRGWAVDDCRVWVAIDPAEGVMWGTPKQPMAGHGLNLRVVARTDHFHLLIGVDRSGAATLRRRFRAVHAEES